MIDLADYRELVSQLAEPVSTQLLALTMAKGHVLAEPVFARYPVPPFDNSAMDGFAVRAADIASLPVTLPISGDIPAGHTGEEELPAGSAMRIMTGAPLPPGADTIVPVENVENSERHMLREHLDEVTIVTEVPAGRHVRLAGEDIAAGELALEAGTRLGPEQLSALASIGHGSVTVYRRPVIGILATGSELVPPGQPLKRGQVPDSNSLLLRGLIERAGATAVPMSTRGDDPVAVEQAFSEAADSVDAIITTGGVSAGAFDVVKEFLTGRGVDFYKVALQPGKPQGCGRMSLGETTLPVLCLPGNPVSAFVSMKLFGEALIGALTGRVRPLPFKEAVAGESWTCRPGRTQLMPARSANGRVYPAISRCSGSHLVYLLSQTEGLIHVPADVTDIKEGDTVEVWWL
ncbi:MAG: molybdopterin molybdotransferase MoeA [Flaviflexus sp.]|nr:molybdopterin molybdotransferase MoeA [Flaviflexus sp.]